MTGTVLAIARRARTRAPMETVGAATISVSAGVDGDHRGQLRRRQVTVITREGWEAACAELGQQLPWTTRRANILVEGLALAEATGRTIRIGEVALTITGETDPCSRMEEQVPGLCDALTPEWRGGVTCDVAHGGEVAVGDGAQLEG